MRGRVGLRGSTGDSRGQTETIGVVLVLAMTLIGATVALAFGATALNDARLSSQDGGIEHAMTQLDSRSAMVALGDSSTQVVPMATAGEGNYRIDPDQGWINITHSDYNDDGDEEVIYNESLGALVYERDDTRIAYQGGGVWREQGGSSTMISPPEFHYQSATLTLPVIQVAGDTSVGGSGITAEITQQLSARRIFPNSSTEYDGNSAPYHNPVTEGNVTVTVKSDYYQAWAEYFRTRTSGEVSVDHASQTASVKLIAVGAEGLFQMPAEGNSIDIRGLGDGHPITDFTLTIRPDGSDSADFNNLQWSLYADQGNQQFEIHLHQSGSANDGGTPCKEVEVAATVYYSRANGDPYHGWRNESALTSDCGDLDGDGDSESFLKVNLVGDTPLTLQSLSKSDLHHYDAQKSSLKSKVNFSEHGDEGVPWEDPGTKFDDGDKTTFNNTTNHYLSLMGPDVEITVSDKNSDTVNEDASTGYFEQQGGTTSFITFLHITENRVEVELD